MPGPLTSLDGRKVKTTTDSIFYLYTDGVLVWLLMYTFISSRYPPLMKKSRSSPVVVLWARLYGALVYSGRLRERVRKETRTERRIDGESGCFL